MKAAIISNGEIKDYGYISDFLKDCDIVICADGGAKHALNFGVVPDIVVGDLDSIGEETLKTLQDGRTKIVKYPKEKDYTDTQLAVNYAEELGADEIILLGSLGDRLDHSIANVLLLVKLVKKNIVACIANEKNNIYITNSEIKLKGKIGDIVSLIPVGGDVTGICTKGLQYKLSGATITLGDPLGISNVFIDEEISVLVSSGFLLVIKSKD